MMEQLQAKLLLMIPTSKGKSKECETSKGLLVVEGEGHARMPKGLDEVGVIPSTRGRGRMGRQRAKGGSAEKGGHA